MPDPSPRTLGAPASQMVTAGDDSLDPLDVDCLGGGRCYVGHGIALVLVATTADVKFWRNSFWLSPASARRLASILIEQADASDALAAQERSA